ncbi:uncharacterized protein METZ01_LOCUS309802 [marine metagenome]|uniref:Uncharacterized protein n=1 Tax=marine metagenome TaxID=408172 RepID=A0A382N8S1_9ZZZZ
MAVLQSSYRKSLTLDHGSLIKDNV